MEVELKLLVDPKYKAALFQHPLLAGGGQGKPHELTLSDTYYDTPDLHLRHNDAGLRVRHEANGWIQNMKNSGTVNSGLHSRKEWESPVAGSAPDLARLRKIVDDKKIRRNLLGGAGLEKRLAPVFTTKVKRTVWNLKLPGGDVVECVFDQGRLECKGKHISISELELELKSGDPSHLFDFALALHQDIPLHIGNRSKADRGYALLEPHAPEAIKATALVLATNMSVEKAFQAIASNCIAHIEGNDERVAGGHDVESLHQMRVGMRRLRSALSMFKSMLHLPDEIEQELAWLATQLGDARDWDVLAESTLPGLAKDMTDPANIDGLQQAATDKAHEHHVTTAAAVASPRYTRLMLNLTRWVQTMGWHEDQATVAATGIELGDPVLKFANKTLKRDQRRLRTRAKNLRAATPEARHRLRIAAKKTRYAAEFFDSLFSPKTVRSYVKALAGLQDELGFLNDAAVADRLLTELSANQSQLEGSVGFAKGFLSGRVINDDRNILKLWKQFKRIGIPHKR